MMSKKYTGVKKGSKGTKKATAKKGANGKPYYTASETNPPVELRAVRSTLDHLYGRTCSDCGKTILVRDVVLGLLPMGDLYLRSVIHLACLEPYLDGAPAESKTGAARIKKAQESLLKIEKSLVAKVK